jgi:HD-like signal output (HDOD) protein
MSVSPSAPTYQSGNKSVAPDTAAEDAAARASAFQFLSQLAAEVSAGIVDLPCFPDIVIRVRKVLSHPQTSAEQIVTVVGAEPRLAARLVQTANSAAFNQSGRPVTDLRSAVTRLGHALIQSAAMAFALQQMKSEESLRSIVKPMGQLWQQSIRVASICHVVARKTAVPPDTAFLTGLLHGIGALYVLVRSVGHAAEANPAFREMINGWHASIGKAVLDNWGFPEEMSDAIGVQDDNEPHSRKEASLSDVLIVSITLANVMNGNEPRRVSTLGVHAFDAVQLTPDECLAMLKHAHQQLASIQETLGR